MELVSKEDGKHYLVATVCSEDSFCVMATLMDGNGPTHVLHYASIAALLRDWEDAE